MYYFLYLFGPTIMIGIGLQLFESVGLTIFLFYGWLFLMLLINRKSLKVNQPNWKNSALVGFGIGVVFFLSLFMGIKWLHPFLFNVEELRAILRQWGFTGNERLVYIGILLVINPVLEEVYWRASLHQKFRKNLGTHQTIYTTSFFYTLYHILVVLPLFQWPLSIFAVIPVFFAGVVWGYLSENSNSIIGPIISHFLADVGIMSVYWFILR
ncbi:CPBP family intramembrane glutamic endopeptidase [Bacillus sp. 2205SS5-2]|uniref:CPBP family intramembrane glutamic endopeptidase n=1 Tax=Bacillus sp. 2205SS5-2 TaxID=3109031 RepID=UPI0030045909